MAATLSSRSLSALISEPRKHIHAVPDFISLYLSRPTKLFSAAFYSALKNPTERAASFESTPVGSFLINDCGFSPEDANGICRRKPDLLRHKSYDNARQTLLFLRDKGFHEIDILKFFSKYPNFLRISFKGNVKPKVKLLEKIGLNGQKLSRVLRYPGFLSSSISRKLEPRVSFLQSVLDPELDVVVSNPESSKITGKFASNHSLTASVIRRNPRILETPTGKLLVGFVKDIEGMGIEKGSKAFARAFIVLSMMNSDTVKRKLENLRELGFTDDEVGILVRRSPELLGSSEDKLLQNLKFLVEEWKLPRNVILSNPAGLRCSIEKRLKPRLNALRALMMLMNKSSEKYMSYPPMHYICMSDVDFHRKVVTRLPVVT